MFPQFFPRVASKQSCFSAVFEISQCGPVQFSIAWRYSPRRRPTPWNIHLKSWTFVNTSPHCDYPERSDSFCFSSNMTVIFNNIHILYCTVSECFWQLLYPVSPDSSFFLVVTLVTLGCPGCWVATCPWPCWNWAAWEVWWRLPGCCLPKRWTWRAPGAWRSWPPSSAPRRGPGGCGFLTHVTVISSFHGI